MRCLRTLVYHYRLGPPGSEHEEFEGAQAYVDGGWAEWVDEGRSAPVETTAKAGAPEAAVARPSARRTR